MDFAAIGPINSTKSSRLLNVVEDIYPGGGVSPRRQDGQRVRKRQKNDHEEKETSVEVSARGFCYKQSVYQEYIL